MGVFCLFGFWCFFKFKSFVCKYAVFIFCNEQSKSTCYLENCQISEVICSSWKTTFQRQNWIFCWLEKFILNNCHVEKGFLHLLLGYTIQMNPGKWKKLKEDVKDCSVNRVRDVPCITGVYIIHWSDFFSRSCLLYFSRECGEACLVLLAITNPFQWGSSPAFLWVQQEEWGSAGFWA